MDLLDVEMNDEMRDTNSLDDETDFFDWYSQHTINLSQRSNFPNTPHINFETFLETNSISETSGNIINTFIHFMNVGHDPIVERNIQRQREGISEFIETSPFLSDIYSNVIENSLNDPPPKRPIPEDVFDTLPVVKADRKLIEINESCVICTEDFSPDEDVLLLSCSHAYHRDCIRKWFREQNVCPICRKVIWESDDRPGSSSDRSDPTRPMDDEMLSISDDDSLPDLDDEILLSLDDEHILLGWDDEHILFHVS